MTPRVRLWAALVAVAALWVASVGFGARSRPSERRHFERGVALGLFASDPEWDYDALLAELVDLGATDVELVVPWLQPSLDATRIAPRAGWSPSSATLARTIAQAHRRGLRVMLFPIVELADRAPGQWRGRIAPGDAAHDSAWWTSYRAFVLAMATAAEAQGAESVSVGSELLLLEGERTRWASLIADVRRAFRGKLLYSANWDHFDGVAFWDLVDEVGVTAYFGLAEEGSSTSRSPSPSPSPSTEALTAAWERRSGELAAYARRVGRPLVLTEVGYPSVAGAAVRPWDHGSDGALDVEQQARCYEAFCATAGQAPFVDGVYFWNWFGVGGVNDRGYTMRGKPAAQVVGGYLREGRGEETRGE